MDNRNKEIAIAGITAALALVFALLSVFIEVLTVTFGFLSALSVMLPIARGRYIGGVLGYIAASLLTMLFGGVINALPFILVYGGFTLLSTLAYEKKVKPYITYPVKILWINGSLALLYLVTKLMVINFDRLGFKPHYLVVCLAATAIGLLYDYVLILVYKRTKRLADKHLGRL